MVQQFIASMTSIQLSVLIYLTIYLLLYGVRYHLLALHGHLSGRGISNDFLGITLNWLGYASIVLCIFWFI